MIVPIRLAAETDMKKKVVICSFFYWGGSIEDALHVKAGKHFFPIAFNRRSRSEPLSMRGTDLIEIHRGIQAANDAKPAYELLAKASLPVDISQALYLVVAPDENNEHYRIIVLDDSNETFPRATFHFVNLSGQMLKVDFSGESRSLAVGEAAVLSSNVDEKGGFVPCTIYDASGKRYYENRLYSQQSERKVVLIGQPKLKGGIPAVGFLSQLLPQIAPVQSTQ